MRVMLNQRVWRQARRSGTTTTGSAVRMAPLQHGAFVTVSLVNANSSRGLHASSRWAAGSSAISTSPLLRASHRTHSLLDLASIQSRSVYSAADEPGFCESELDAEAAKDDAAATEEESPYLEVLELAYKGEKNWNVAHDIFTEIVENNGAGLTSNVATALIEVFAARHRYEECLETLRYTRQQGIRPRIHAYSSTLACCYKELKFSQALRVFEIMRNDGYVPQHVTYSRALSAALKASQHELVLEIFDDMLRNHIEPSIITYNSILNSCARNGDVHSALGVLRAIKQRGLEMSQSSYHSLAICGGKTGRWELARDAYNGLRDSGFSASMTMYNSVIAAYAKGKRWDDIITLYNELPEDMQHMLQHAYLGAVIMAFAKADDLAVQRRALAIFEMHKELGKDAEINLFAHNAVLLCYLNANELDKLHAHADEMAANGIKWDGLTYQNVILGHLRGGDAKTAQQLLSKHVKMMEYSTVCYRELIDYHSEVKNDALTACRLSMEMMQHNPRLSRKDWHTALACALKSSNRAIYWNFRKWLKVRAALIIDEIPKELMLNEEDEPKPKYKNYNKQNNNHANNKHANKHKHHHKHQNQHQHKHQNQNQNRNQQHKHKQQQQQSRQQPEAKDLVDSHEERKEAQV